MASSYKPGPQALFLVDRMSKLETKLLEAVTRISERLDSFDKCITSMGSDAAEVQSQMDLSMRSILALQKEQVILLQAMNSLGAPGTSGSNCGVMGSSPVAPGVTPTPPAQPSYGPLHGTTPSLHLSHSGGSPALGHMDTDHRRQWVPKMDFPKFDGSDVRIWLDKCTSYFQLYAV
jgi:hypothetical protein